MLGVVVTVLSSICFGVNSVFVRRATPLARTRTGVLITLILGPPTFLVLAAAFGQLGRVREFTWLSLGALAVAGIVHFVLGRSLNYSTVSLLGAPRASILANMSPLMSIGMAVALFREEITPAILLGAFLMVFGPILIAQKSAGRSPEPALEARKVRRGMMMGLAASLCYGTSPLLIKLAMRQAALPIAGTLVSYTAAFALLGSTLFHPAVRSELVHSNTRGLLWYAAAGMAVNIAQLLRYTALSLAPVSLVSPLIQLATLFTLLFSFGMNRRLEVLDKSTVSGALLVVAGAVILTS